MKKTIAALLIFSLMLSLCGCAALTAPSVSEKKLSIVTTIFPLYDWAREILGDRSSEVELTLLLDNGVDLHSYQPTADDIIRISECDLFLYVGGESDQWVDDALKEAINQQMVVLDLLDLLGDSVKEEEAVEGMEPEAEEEEPEYDEHVWLSLKNASVICQAICQALSGLDPDHTAEYQTNLTVYQEALSDLDRRYQAAADTAALHTLLFGDRFPFRYLVDDYGLDYYAAFAGCSAETEASFETIIFLANKVDELHLPVILQIESSDGTIPNTIRQNTAAQDQQILTLDSMQSVTSREMEAGVTYTSIMSRNLDVLTAALSN